MTLKGSLADFSLPEIFQFVEEGYKTGLLSIQAEISEQPETVHHLWIHAGRIVAMADRLDDRGLLSMIQQRGWLKSEILNLLPSVSEAKQPLGMLMKSEGIMTAEQLKLLFHAQVLQRVCSLFKLSSGQFVFDTKAQLSTAEMTGLSMSASEATLLGLRVLRNWSSLKEKLPEPNCGLMKAISGKPNLHLDTQEWQVWEYTDGSLPIDAIAKQLQLPVLTVQQIGFRLSVVGLVEEVPITTAEPALEIKMPELPVSAAHDTTSNSLKASFLQNLVGFLKTKTKVAA